jgi:zinc/manganese transport system permease protein
VSTWDLLQVDFVQNALMASLLLGLVSGALAPLIVMRKMSFAAHATGELALMGAAAALLFGVSVTTGAVLGAVLAAVVLALLGLKEQDATVGVVLAFGMGLSVLFIYLYPGRTSEAYALLTGQIVGVSGASLGILALMAVLVVGAVAVLWRPLLFATVDPVMAAASGVPVKLLAAAFAVLIGIVASQGVQIVGALLLLALLITPGAAAVRVTSNPLLAVVLSAALRHDRRRRWSGALPGTGTPGQPLRHDSISFAIYLVCRAIGWARGRRVIRDEIPAARSLPEQTRSADPHHPQSVS